MNGLSPLSWENVRIPYWIRLVPLFDFRHQYAKRQFEGILKQRLQQETMDLWKEFAKQNCPGDPIRFVQIVETASRIIADSCPWPIANFIPADDCDVLFFGDMDMGGVVAQLRLEDEFVQGKALPEKLNRTYGELILDLFKLDECSFHAQK